MQEPRRLSAGACRNGCILLYLLASPPHLPHRVPRAGIYLPTPRPLPSQMSSNTDEGRQCSCLAVANMAANDPENLLELSLCDGIMAGKEPSLCACVWRMTDNETSEYTSQVSLKCLGAPAFPRSKRQHPGKFVGNASVPGTRSLHNGICTAAQGDLDSVLPRRIECDAVVLHRWRLEGVVPTDPARVSPGRLVSPMCSVLRPGKRHPSHVARCD